MAPSDHGTAPSNSGNVITRSEFVALKLFAFTGGGIGLVSILLTLASIAHHGVVYFFPFGQPPPISTPIVVRGGSVELFSNKPWTQTTTGTSPLQTSASTTILSSLSLDGVIPKGGNTPQQYSATGLTANWVVTLTFRNKAGLFPASTDPIKTLSICTNLDNSGECSSVGNLTGTSLYVVGDGSGSFGYSSSVNGSSSTTIDSYDIRRYDLNSDPNACSDVNGSARDTPCNHLAGITVAGISQWDDGATVTTFRCLVGACDIYVGSQAQVVGAK
jgi:hypothetical protein